MCSHNSHEPYFEEPKKFFEENRKRVRGIKCEGTYIGELGRLSGYFL